MFLMVVHTIPGKHLPWEIMHNALQGLQIYLVDGRHEELCSFQILQEMVRVGWGYIKRTITPPPSLGGGMAVS